MNNDEIKNMIFANTRIIETNAKSIESLAQHMDNGQSAFIAFIKEIHEKFITLADREIERMDSERKEIQVIRQKADTQMARANARLGQVNALLAGAEAKYASADERMRRIAELSESTGNGKNPDAMEFLNSMINAGSEIKVMRLDKSAKAKLLKDLNVPNEGEQSEVSEPGR